MTGNADGNGSDALGEVRGAPSDPDADSRRRRFPWLLGGVAVLIVGLGVGIGLAVAGGDDGSKVAVADNKKVVSTSTPTTSKPTTTVTVTATTVKGSTSVTTAASRGGVTPTTARTNPSTTPPTSAPPTTTTTTLKPLGQSPPQFLSASASPGLAFCETRGASALATITWDTADATSVTLTYPGIFTTPPLPATGSQGALYRCGLDTTTVTLTAVGPAGTAVTTVSWNYRIVDGS